MFLPRSLAACFLGGAMLASPAVAQKITPKKITFSGTSTSQSDLLAASGLRQGEALEQTDIQAAAQKLIDTGMFSDVHFTFDGDELNYTLKPADGMQPVFWANFPWWSDPALTAAVAARVPLFHGELPAESPMEQQVTVALTQLLAEKGVAATVTRVPRGSLGADKGSGIEYHIDAPRVEVGTIHLSGVSADWAEPVLAIQKAATGQDFDGATKAKLATVLGVLYHRQGYLQMALTAYAHGTPELADGKVMVPVSATVEQGPQYRVRTLSFAGDDVVTAEDFARMAKLHLADIANEDRLHETLAEMSRAYRRHGYLRAKIDAASKPDPMTRTVDYTITARPGPVFTMGTLGLVNVSAVQRAEFLKVWPLKEGAAYDQEAVAGFLVKYKNQLPSLDGWSASYKEYEHQDAPVVDLVVTFRQGGPLR